VILFFFSRKFLEGDMKRKYFWVYFVIVFSSFNFAQLANHVVIAEVYGGGGNAGSYWQNDYIILYNPTSSSVDISTWSVQYAASGSASWEVTNLEGSIDAGSYYAIQEAQGSGGSASLPFTPNVIGIISMSATSGKVALVNNQTALTESDPTGNADIVDFVGYGSANAYEGAGSTPTLSNTSSARRKDNEGNSTYGINGSGWDTDDNSTDFYKESDIENNQPLPVELSSFSASIVNEGVKLEWRTETEINNYGFDVERSSTPLGTKWNVIEFIKGFGNSNSPREYLFVDKNITCGEYAYRLKQIDNDGTFEYSKILEVTVNVPLKYELNQNYPNPFNPATEIAFTIPQAGMVTLKVYNTLGEEIAVLVNGFIEPGIHTVNFNASGLNSGIYFYKLESRDFIQVKKMILLK
jgi:Lamin Tail Domain/Secretion system C-terminal sorting domain